MFKNGCDQLRKPISLTSDDSNSGIELLDRDVSILAFNERVLDWAKRPEVPLLERLRYLCIVSSNLDEFFEVRADLHMSAFRNGDEKGTYNTKTFETVYNTARDLVNEQYSLYNAVLLPSLQKKASNFFLMQIEIWFKKTGLKIILDVKSIHFWCL